MSLYATIFFLKKFIKIYLRSGCGQSRDKAGKNVSGIRMRKFEEGPATSIVCIIVA